MFAVNINTSGLHAPVASLSKAVPSVETGVHSKRMAGKEDGQVMVSIFEKKTGIMLKFQ